MKQLSLLPKPQKKRYSRYHHGGQSGRGRRKLERPLSSKKWIHLVLKSDKAKGRLSLLTVTNQIYIKRLINAKGKQFGIAIADYANVGNHLHLKIRCASRAAFQRFLRSITTQIARKVTGARRGKKFGRFWQHLAYTRVLNSSLEELRLKGYFIANRKEAAEGPAAREAALNQFNAWVRGLRDRHRDGLGPPSPA